MVDETTYSELDRYFTGRMQGEERAAFELRLSSDANLKTELDWIVNATAAMKNSGRMVMKQHIAAAIAGVPANALLKYRPAKNAKPFWKKWWFWIAAVTVAVAVGGVVVYANTWEDEGGGYHFFDSHEPHYDEQEEEHSVTRALMDSVVSKPAPADSSLEEMKADSTKAEVSDDVVNEQVVVAENQKHYNVDQQGQVSPVYVGNITQSEVRKEKPMNTRINLRRQPPYAYFLDDNLTLYANYTSTAGFTFRGSGDTIYMTDNAAQTFMLLRGKGEQPLVPLRGANK